MTTSLFHVIIFPEGMVYDGLLIIMEDRPHARA